MNRHSASQRSSIPLAIVAVAVAFFVLIGGVITLLPTGDQDDAFVDRSTEIEITPGAEVSRLETVVAENPEDVDSMVVLAEVLANSGRTQDAIPWFERAVATRPDDADLRLAFGRALDRAGHAFDAELQLRRAAELDPEDNAAAFYLGMLYERSAPPKPDDARAWYRRAIEIAPDSVIAEQARARLQALDPDASSTPGP